MFQVVYELKVWRDCT